MRFARVYRDTPEAIARLLVQSPDGVRVPLAQLARIDEVVGPRQITREKGQRLITVQCNVTDRDIGTFVDEAQKAIEDQVTLPPGYLVTWGGQFRLQQEANKRLAIVVPITLSALFPLLFATGVGLEVQRPLATVVVGGLVTSTVLTLLVLPALYRWFAVVPEPGAVPGRTRSWRW